MSQTEEILSLLRERPNLRAQEIAQALGVDRRSVNALLHGSLRGKVVQDNSYRWSLLQAADNGDRIETSRYKGNDTPLARLSRYYLDCLSFDADNGVSLFAASKYGQLDYFDPGLSSLETTLAEGLHVQGVQPLFATVESGSEPQVPGSWLSCPHSLRAGPQRLDGLHG